ncbi:hypothetical protein LQF64_12480, partial [Tetragenococcus koreensis]|nr:hypothetical protein [Tetragenococcus koreensis]
DTINHQKLMHRMQWYIADKEILQLIWNFLNAGVLDGDIIRSTPQGAQQGGLCEASHKPPYAKYSVMQSKLQKAYG